MMFKKRCLKLLTILWKIRLCNIHGAIWFSSAETNFWKKVFKTWVLILKLNRINEMCHIIWIFWSTCFTTVTEFQFKSYNLTLCYWKFILQERTVRNLWTRPSPHTVTLPYSCNRGIKAEGLVTPSQIFLTWTFI